MENKREVYYVTVCRESVDKDTTYTNIGPAVEKIKSHLKEFNMDSFVEDYTSLGYDDVTMIVKDRGQAIMVATTLDYKIGKATDIYMESYEPKVNASVEGPVTEIFDEDGGYYEMDDSTLGNIIY